ncbi:MAG: RsmG family class I SAM-dependent methyltransferase [Candidatus Zixiibacteriota bacterium]
MSGAPKDLGPVDLAALIDRYLDRTRLDRYFELLMEHNQRVNLVSRETSRADFDRLVGESLLPLAKIRSTVDSYLDIGSGGGIPAIPIILSSAVSAESTLVERTIKKARALEALVRDLGLKAAVLPQNFEELRDLPPLNLITLRLSKPTEAMLIKIRRSLAPGGTFVYYSTPQVSIPGFKGQVYTYRSTEDPVAKSLTVFRL